MSLVVKAHTTYFLLRSNISNFAQTKQRLREVLAFYKKTMVNMHQLHQPRFAKIRLNVSKTVMKN